MLAAMPTGLLAQWIAFFELEPFGTAREDLRAGVVASSIGNFAAFRDKNAKTFKPSDFFENLRPPMVPMKAADLAQQAKNLTASMGGRVQTREEGLKRQKAENERKAKIEETRAKNAALTKEHEERRKESEEQRKNKRRK